MICCVSRLHHPSPGTHLLETSAEKYTHCFTEIAVVPLSSVDRAILLSNLIKIKDPTSRLVNLILQKAEGNPFFLEEVVMSLIDTRVVEQNISTGRWQVIKAIENITIPHTLRGVIVAHIDSFAEDTKEVLKVASIIGRRFFYCVLAVVC